VTSLNGRKKPGVCVPWEDKRKGWNALPGDENVVRDVWEHTDSLANTYLWQLLLSF
jgi:hypothetical protein